MKQLDVITHSSRERNPRIFETFDAPAPEEDTYMTWFM